MDGLWGSLFGLSALGAFGGDEEGAGIALLGASALFFASAVRGNNAANSCRGAYEEYNAGLMSSRRDEMIAGPGPSVVPRPAVKKKPAKKPPPPIEPADTMAPEQIDPQPPVVADPAPEPVAPEYASPRPPTAKPAAPVPPPKQLPPPPPAKKQPPPPPDDEWGDFWKEVP